MDEQFGTKNNVQRRSPYNDKRSNGIPVEINSIEGIFCLLEPDLEEIPFKPLESFLLRRLESGGLIPELKQQVKRQKET
ncbi:MAG: hypothetical protein ACXABU_17415 [Candidatus Hodarchaeales archaeon]